ncbi:hypothetical protein SprV_0401649800 [Sparganum proliferum]
MDFPRQVDYSRSGRPLRGVHSPSEWETWAPGNAGDHTRLGQLAAISGIWTRLRVIEANMQQLRQMDRRLPVSALSTNPLPSALERMSDFDIFGENILRDDHRQETMAFLQTLDGNTARDFVKRQLRSLFANSLLPGFNLNGRYSKRNFRQTNTFKRLQDVYRGCRAGRPLTPLDFEKSVRSTLKSAVTAASVRRRRQNDPE